MEEAPQHPFEEKGLGRAPYVLTSIYEDGRSAFVPLCKTGRCAFCGKPIKINCIIRSMDGTLSAVGSDCVERIGDTALAKSVRREVSKRLAQKRADERAERDRQRRASWEATLAAQRARNGGFTDAEIEMKKLQERRLQNQEGKGNA